MADGRLRRSANGELAEILGPALLEHDKTQRVLQIRLTAQRIYDHLPAADRARLDAYARGVNLFIAQCEQSHTLPVEFRLLMYRPQPWSGVDSISVGLAHGAGARYARRHQALARTRLRPAQRPQARSRSLPGRLLARSSAHRHQSGPERAAAAAPALEESGDEDDDDENTETRAVPGSAPISPALAAPEDTHALMALLGLPDCDGCAPGSNNWVVAGSHTASGKPLLSNDMHLTLREPDTWYMADLRAPGFHAAGVTLPGLPLVVAGHNEHVAWGFTALEADVQDLYYEKLDGKGNYEGNDAQWHPLAVDREVIHVRGGKDVVLDVQSTAHGPLMNPILAASDPPIALKWTLYDPSLNALPLYEMNTASNWTEFSAALAPVVLAHAKSCLRRRSGAHRVPRHRQVPIRGPDGKSIFDIPLPHDTMDLRFEWGKFVGAEGAADLHPLRPDAQRLRSALRISGHGQLARDHRQIALPAHATTGSIPIASSASTKPSTAATSSRPKTCWPSRPTSTAKWIRRWAIASPTPSTTLPAPKATAIRACARPPT